MSVENTGGAAAEAAATNASTTGAQAPDFAAQLAEATRQAETYKAQLAERDTALADWAAKAADWGVTEAALRSGLTDTEGLATAKLLYNALPTENRPAFTDWLGTKPKALTPWLSPAATPAAALAASSTTEGAPPAGGGVAAPPLPGMGGAQPAIAGGAPSVTALVDQLEAANRSGNLEQATKLAAQIRALKTAQR